MCVHVLSTGAVGSEALRNNAQENAQHHVEHRAITMHEGAQALDATA